MAVGSCRASAHSGHTAAFGLQRCRAARPTPSLTPWGASPACLLACARRSGCLPDWTPVLGLRQEVAHFNSLPPSLFTTLGALVTVLQAGLELQPVGLQELQRYDK